MTLLTKFRKRAGDDAGFARIATIGAATVVHGVEGGTAEARTMAARLPPDSDHDLVVADLPPDAPVGVWESVASVIPKGRRPVRLVPGRHPREMNPQVAQWLAERLGRPVLAPYGATFQDTGGTVFVHPEPNSGWLRFQRGSAPSWEAQRFPSPAWDSPAVAEVRRLSATAVLEPLPAGVWLRTNAPDDWLAAARSKLARSVPCRLDVLMIILGGEHIPELPLEAISAFWTSLSEADRARARFIRFGPVEQAGGRGLGRAIADLLNTEIRCYTGIPVGAQDASDVVTLKGDGSHGWRTCAEQLVYRPHDIEPARLCAYRPPIPGMPEVSPAVYRYTPEAVIEIVRAGLWIRSPGEPSHSAAVRSAPADPARQLLLFDGADVAQLTSMRSLAERLKESLDYPTRLVTAVLPVTAVISGQRITAPATEPQPAHLESVGGVEDQAQETRPAPSDGAEHEGALPWLSQLMETRWIMPPEGELITADGDSRHGIPPATGSLEAARSWLGETWPDEMRAHIEAVKTIVAANPKIFGADVQEHLAIDIAALRMYLTGQGLDVDTGLRAGKAEPYLAFARCVAEGLSSLPQYRGATTTTLTPSAEQWSFFQDRSVVTEPGFLTLLAAPCALREGDTDLLVWSATGRRTMVVEPGDGVIDRIVFVPGTRFKVLEVVEPRAAERGRILLRELPPTELTADGEAVANRASLDKVVKTSLQRGLERWAAAEPVRRVPPAAVPRLQVLPGAGDE